MTRAAIRSLQAAPAMYVAANMRPEDAREIFATRFPLADGSDNPAQVAADVVGASRFGAVAWWGAEPVCALGAIETWPGVYAVWMFATPAWPRVARPVTRWCLRTLRPLLLAAGGHRAYCHVLASYAAALGWLARLGFVQEAAHPGYGRAREDFVSMVWRLPDVPDQPVRQQAERPVDAAGGAAAGAGA